jgi:hypothetical protein
MSKYKAKAKGKFRSKLEQTAANLLTEEGVWFEYEPYAVTFLKGYKSNILSYEKVGKKFKEINRVYKISYTPDFVGKGWVMETKGMKTPDFQIKWKLFKKHLEDNQIDAVLFMPTNKKEIIESISIIKQLNNEKVTTN